MMPVMGQIRMIGEGTSVGGTAVTSFSLVWKKKPRVSRSAPSLRTLNARLTANYDRVMAMAEANTKRLTGKPSL